MYAYPFHYPPVTCQSRRKNTNRNQPRPVKTEEQYDQEWTAKYGADGAALIRKTVDANMADYLYLKQFAMKV